MTKEEAAAIATWVRLGGQLYWSYAADPGTDLKAYVWTKEHGLLAKKIGPKVWGRGNYVLAESRQVPPKLDDEEAEVESGSIAYQNVLRLLDERAAS